MLKPEYNEEVVASLGLPDLSHGRAMLYDLIPAQMHLSSLIAIARRLSLYKERNLANIEAEELVRYVKGWVSGLTKHGVCKQLDKVDFSNDHLLYLAMGELEFLVHHELVARQTHTKIHKDDPSNFFDLNRLKKFSSEFLSQQLRWKDVGLLAATDLHPNMENIFSILEHSPDTLQRVLNTVSST